MPCRTDVCQRCNDYDCQCGQPQYEEDRGFDHKGAICDLIQLIEENRPLLLEKVDPATMKWYLSHEKAEAECIKREALAKLTNREKRALGLK